MSQNRYSLTNIGEHNPPVRSVAVFPFHRDPNRHPTVTLTVTLPSP